MSRTLRLYYYMVLGALGGLVGMKLIEEIGFLDQPNIYLNDALLGAALGFTIGFLVGFAEAFLSQSLIRGLRAAAISGVVGLIAGGIALPLGELALLGIDQQIAGRAIGWAAFGALVGLAATITGGSQFWKGALGGLLGGAVGGILLELVRIQFDNPLIGKIAGLVLLGAAIGIFTALIVVALSRAWLEVASGKLSGTEFILDKFLRETAHAAIIGSNVLKSDIALPDPDIAPQHAQIKGAGSHFVLKDMSVQQGTFVNGSKIEQKRLGNRDKIRMGSTDLIYHEKR